MLTTLFLFDFKRRLKSSFTIGYHIIFPLVMIVLLGSLLSKSFTLILSGYEYYTITMLPFCSIMGLITAAYAGKEESYAKTACRFLFAPITEKQIFSAKLLSCTLVFSLCNFLVYWIVAIVFQQNIGNCFFPVIALLSSLSYCVCALGLFIGLGMKNFIVIKNFLNLPISVFAIIGGTFYPFGSLNPILNLVINLSPLTWMNRSIILSIYDRSSKTLYVTMVVLLVIGFIFTLLGINSFDKEEFQRGDLPGYEK